jgi:hypothetical protein
MGAFHPASAFQCATKVMPNQAEYEKKEALILQMNTSSTETNRKQFL